MHKYDITGWSLDERADLLVSIVNYFGPIIGTGPNPMLTEERENYKVFLVCRGRMSLCFAAFMAGYTAGVADEQLANARETYDTIEYLEQPD